MGKSIKSSKIMVLSERFEVYKYSGGKKEEKTEQRYLEKKVMHSVLERLCLK